MGPDRCGAPFQLRPGRLVPPARCVAVGVYDLGLTSDELLALEQDFFAGLFDLDADLIDAVFDLIDDCDA